MLQPPEEHGPMSAGISAAKHWFCSFFIEGRSALIAVTRTPPASIRRSMISRASLSLFMKSGYHILA